MSAYLCPKCGALPHWNAVVLGAYAVPRRWPMHVDLPDREEERRAAILSISADICGYDPDEPLLEQVLAPEAPGCSLCWTDFVTDFPTDHAHEEGSRQAIVEAARVIHDINDGRHVATCDQCLAFVREGFAR